MELVDNCESPSHHGHMSSQPRPRIRRPHITEPPPPPGEVRRRFFRRQASEIKPKGLWPVALRSCDIVNVAAALELVGGDWDRLHPGPDGTVLVK